MSAMPLPGGNQAYRFRIMQIQQGFINGAMDRETCLTAFEDLLHEYGLLPVEEQLDRTITNENFVALLRLAQDQRGIRSNRDPEISKDNLHQNAMQAGMAMQHYRISDSVLQNCPVCKEKASGLYNRMQSLDSQTISVDPPRCKSCMVKWVEQHFGTGIGNRIGTPYPFVTVDETKVTAMDGSEADFFKEYEEQMRDFKP